MAEKPRFRQRTVFAKNLGFGVGFGYRNNTKVKVAVMAAYHLPVDQHANVVQDPELADQRWKRSMSSNSVIQMTIEDR